MIQSVVHSPVRVNPRAHIIQQFLNQYFHVSSSVNIICPKCNKNFLPEILHAYANVRLFFFVKQYNAVVKKNKKGGELRATHLQCQGGNINPSISLE